MPNSGCDIRHAINITFVICGRIAKRIDLSQDNKNKFNKRERRIMNDNNFNYDREDEEKYSKLNVFERAWDTLEHLGIYTEGEELLKFLEGFTTKEKLVELINDFNRNSLGGVNPIRHIEERAEAVEMLLSEIKEEVEEEKQQET